MADESHAIVYDITPKHMLCTARSLADTRTQVWDLESGEVLCSLTGHIGYVTGVVWLPDGVRVASASWDETIKLWSTTKGEVLYTFTGHSGKVNSLCLAPDGERQGLWRLCVSGAGRSERQNSRKGSSGSA